MSINVFGSPHRRRLFFVPLAWSCFRHIPDSCDPRDPSLGCLEDISPAQIYRAELTSVVFFFLSFVAIYSLNETNISSFQSFQILFFSVFLFLCSNFPVFYFLSFSCLSLLILYFLFLSFFVCLLLSFLLLSIFFL